MVIMMVIDIKQVFRQHHDGNHFHYGGDDCDTKDGNTTYGYFHMDSVIRGNPEGECDFTREDLNVIMFVLHVCFRPLMPVKSSLAPCNFKI